MSTDKKPELIILDMQDLKTPNQENEEAKQREML